MKRENSHHGTIASLSIGFILSILLTLSAYVVVVEKLISSDFLVIVIICLAFMQFVVQMIFFLHLDKEAGPRWNLIIFLSTASVVLIVIIGSLWIMQNLNYNMSPQHVDQYIQQEEGIYK
jgi:cytochrome o ubiquinol oxidase operon protein cyoD